MYYLDDFYEVRYRSTWKLALGATANSDYE